MRKMAKAILAVVAIAAAIMTGCKNDINNFATVKGNGIDAAKTVELSITTSGNYTIFPTDKKSASKSARTIVADAYNANEVTFYLYGRNETKGVDLEPQVVEVTSSDGKTGTAYLDIGSYVWHLYLTACDNADLPSGTTPTVADIEAKAVLKGESTCDLRGTVKPISFILTPDGLTKKAQLELSIYTDGWDLPDTYSVDIGLYELKDSSIEISTASPAATDTDTIISALTKTNIGNSSASAYKYTANDAEITGGTYNLVIKFTSTETGKTYFYTDDIIILPGKKNTSTVPIPDCIELPPAVPTEFKVGYIEPTDSTENYYNAEFTWVRSSSKTEKFYELEIASLGDEPTTAYTTIINSAGLIDDDTDWTTQVGTYTDPERDTVVTTTGGYSTLTTVTRYDENFKNHPYIWAAGSLQRASTTATVKLALGSRYFARIRAVNDAGHSEWVYVSYADTTNGKAYTSTTMNLYRIKYETEPYTWSPAPAATILYKCETPDGIAIENPKDGVLKDGEAPWTNWKEYNAIGEDPDPYTGYENLSLIPVFGKLANIGIHDDQDCIIPLTSLSFDNSLAIANGTLEVDIGTIKSVTLTVSFTENPGITYDSMYLTLAKSSNLDATVDNKNLNKKNNTITFNTDELYTGKYTATLHYTAKGRQYTTSFIISIIE